MPGVVVAAGLCIPPPAGGMAVSAEADRVSVLMRYSVVMASFISVSISVRQIVTAQHLSMGPFVLRRSGR